MSLLLGAIFSPIVIMFIMWLITQDLRKSYLISLVIYSLFTFVNLVSRLIRNASPTKALKFLFTGVSSVVFVVTLAIYWGIYLLIWSSNFSL